MRFLWIGIALLYTHFGTAQNRLFYAGNSGNESFNDVMQLSDGTILIGGEADDLDWLPSNVPQIDLGTGTISNDQGTNRFAFLLHLDSTLDSVLQVIYISQGGAENIRFIKSSNLPRTKTGSIFISGNTEDTNTGGYFIGKLDNNFVDGLPTGFEWTYNAKCQAGDYPKNYQPWDVDKSGRVYFVRGDSHDFNWSILHRLDEDGQLDIVENWRTHWKVGGGEYRNTPASSYTTGVQGLEHSGIVFKKDSRCNLRSWTQQDYDLVETDGNGGWKQGKWPFDVFFDAPCDPQGNTPTSGPGYTGYNTPSGTITYGPSSITVDRKTGNLYFGINSKSVLPNGNPDFEPAVIAMDSTGQLLWWSRLYHEIRPDSTQWNSSPDQYIDGLAVDYTNDFLVVMARCHGNNNENFWEGNNIFHNPSANGFQNRFSGNNGNIHISWLGKLETTTGILNNSTYVAEYTNNPTGLGAAHSNSLLDGWADPNAGWPTLNTTRLKQNTLTTTADGSVIVIGKGRRTITTNNAHQKMPKPNNGSTSSWNYFVRQYNSDLSLPLYSSLVVGVWDTLTEQLPLNTELFNTFKMEKGILVVGKHLGTNNDILTINTPTWGATNYNGESAILGYFEAAEIENISDNPVITTTNIATVKNTETVVRVFPNPTDQQINIVASNSIINCILYDMMGRQLLSSSVTTIDIKSLPTAIYILKVTLENGEVINRKIIKQ